MPDLSSHIALVTGASSGIGREFARKLAGWNATLILSARRKERLDELANELTAAHNVKCYVVPQDLGVAGGATALHQAVSKLGLDVSILINNAGFGPYQDLLKTPLERHQQLVQLNIMSLLELTYLFVQGMQSKNRDCYVLNVASVAGFLPIPHFANYGASKAYIHMMSQSLACELAHTKIRVSSLCPGPTESEFSQVAGQKLAGIRKSSRMSAERCAHIGLTGMLRGKRAIVPGFSNKLMALAIRLVPTRLASATAPLVMGKPARESALLRAPAE